METEILHWDRFNSYMVLYKDAADNTMKNYKIDLRVFFEFTQGKIPVGIHTFQHFTEYLLNNRKESRATINRRLSTLKSFYNFLHDERIINIDVSPKIKYVRPDAKKVKIVMPHKDIFKTLEGINHLRDRALLETLYATGVREEEISKFNIQDIDFENHLVAVIKGKNKKTRIIPISEKALKFIKAYIGVRKDGPLFLNNRAGRITPRSIYNIAMKYFQIPPHDLRHAFATNMLMNGVPTKAVSEILGHASEKFTEKTYVHVQSHHLSKIYKQNGGMEEG